MLDPLVFHLYFILYIFTIHKNIIAFLLILIKKQSTCKSCSTLSLVKDGLGDVGLGREFVLEAFPDGRLKASEPDIPLGDADLQ